MGLFTTSKLVSDLIKDVTVQFGDEANIQINNSDIIRWANSAQREILISNRILRTTGTTDITAGVSEYTLDGLNVVAIQSIHYLGRKLVNRSFNDAEEFIQKNDPLKTATGDPSMWFEWGGTINLYPTPTVDAVAGLIVYYIKEPDKLISSTDILSVPDSYYESVLEFVLMKAYESDDDAASVQAKLGQFNQRLSVLSEQETSPAQDTYPLISIRYEDM